MRSLLQLALLALALQAGAQTSTHSQAATENLVQGITAYKAGQYEEATRDFQSAVDAEPGWTTARLYLGTALAYQVIPNIDSPENVALADRALEQFNQILAAQAQAPGHEQDLAALRQIATLQRNIKRFDDAVATERKIIALVPDDAEAHYTVGVIEWTQAYNFTLLTLAGESLKDDGVGNTASCTALTSHNRTLVDDSIGELNRGVELRPNYSDAMQYLNLAFRQRASLDCSDPARRAQDLATADEWIRRSVEARKQIEQQRMQQAVDPSHN
jgi:tetratricopeptide (TPR) repeat protein